MRNATRGHLLRVLAVAATSMAIWLFLEWKHRAGHSPGPGGQPRQQYIHAPGVTPASSVSSRGALEATTVVEGPGSPSANTFLDVSVVDEAGGSLEGAKVWVTGRSLGGESSSRKPARAGGFTGADGKVTLCLTLRDLRDGEAIASCSGFRPARTFLSEFPPGTAGSGIQLRMERGLSITGFVRDELGSPVPGVEIRAHGPRTGGAWAKGVDGDLAFEDLPDLEKASSSLDGAFALTGLRDADYVLTAGARGTLLAYDSRRGVSPVHAGTVGVELVVRRTALARLRIVDADSGSPVRLSEAIIDVDSSEGVTGWAPANIAEQVTNLPTARGEAGEWVFPIHLGKDSTAETELLVSVHAMGYQSAKVRATLHALDMDSLPPAQEVRLEPDTGPKGELRVRSTSEPDPAHPYLLLLRNMAGEDNRWFRKLVRFDTKSREWSSALPVGEYEVSGQGMGLTTSSVPFPRVRVEESKVTAIEVSPPREQWGDLSWIVLSERGLRVSDYYYRLVSKEAFLRGNENTMYQGFVGSSAGDPAEPERRAGVLRGEYVLVVVKNGFHRTDAEVRVGGDATPTFEVRVRER